MAMPMKKQQTISLDQQQAATALLFREARFIDNQQWDEWIELFDQQAEYWIPSWDGQHQLVDDPRTGISLMYYADRSGIEDRIFRIRTGLSSASSPLPRTVHSITNIEVEALDGGQLFVRSNWQCMSYRWKVTTTFVGHYEHTLKPAGDGSDNYLITRKRIVVKNDLIPIPMDIYNV
ncbi:MAG: aromatic-ring-hydroxylating dioxygenase subunit beta [Porticoccaceae bacterium]